MVFGDSHHIALKYRFLRRFLSLNVTLSHLHDKKRHRTQYLNTLSRTSLKTPA